MVNIVSVVLTENGMVENIEIMGFSERISCSQIGPKYDTVKLIQFRGYRIQSI